VPCASSRRRRELPRCQLCWRPDGERSKAARFRRGRLSLKGRASSPGDSLGFRDDSRVGTARPCLSIAARHLSGEARRHRDTVGGGKPPGNWRWANGLLACRLMRKQPGSMRRCRRRRERGNSGPGPDCSPRERATLLGACVETSSCGAPLCVPTARHAADRSRLRNGFSTTSGGECDCQCRALNRRVTRCPG